MWGPKTFCFDYQDFLEILNPSSVHCFYYGICEGVMGRGGGSGMGGGGVTGGIKCASFTQYLRSQIWHGVETFTKETLPKDDD